MSIVRIPVSRPFASLPPELVFPQNRSGTGAGKIGKMAQETLQNLSPLVEIPVDRSILPEGFCKKIEAKNGKKTLYDPIAIYLLPEMDDVHQSFSRPVDQFHILRMAKTHIIAIKNLKNGDIGTAIKELQPVLNRLKPSLFKDLLILVGHGTADSIQFGKGDKKTACYFADRVKKEDFSGLRQRTIIILQSCKTAQILARKISSVYPHAVFAPQKDSIAVLSYFHQCEKHGVEFVSYGIDRKQHVKKFIEGKEKKICTDHTLFTRIARYVKKRADRGDPIAQEEMAEFYRQGIGVKKSMFHTLKYLLRAAENEAKVAQYKLGAFFNGESDRLAYKWYSRSAKQNYPPAILALRGYSK